MEHNLIYPTPLPSHSHSSLTFNRLLLLGASKLQLWFAYNIWFGYGEEVTKWWVTSSNWGRMRLLAQGVWQGHALVDNNIGTQYYPQSTLWPLIIFIKHNTVNNSCYKQLAFFTCLLTLCLYFIIIFNCCTCRIYILGTLETLVLCPNSSKWPTTSFAS
jgi:hypothetical protein